MRLTSATLTHQCVFDAVTEKMLLKDIVFLNFFYFQGTFLQNLCNVYKGQPISIDSLQKWIMIILQIAATYKK